MYGRLPLHEQLAALRTTLERNETLVRVLDKAADVAPPNWYVTAGCLFQTVWNVVTGRPPAEGIKDYDVFYFDDGDLSWEAEDQVIKAFADVFNLVVRPNPVLAPRHVYEAKTARWRRQWPALRVLDWPA
ncbi:nucleotidyltransferase family protein [Actinoplanes sp. CA-131856]